MKKNINTKEYWDMFYNQDRFQNKHKWRVGTYRAIMKALETYNYKFNDRFTVLDAGCAFGDGIDYLCHQDIFKGGIFKGIDFSDECISWAKYKYNQYTFEAVDINNFDLKKLYFNVIIASEILEHLDNWEEVLEKLRANCDTLIITVPNKEDKNNLIDEHIRSFSGDDFPEAKKFVTDNTLVVIYKQ